MKQRGMEKRERKTTAFQRGSTGLNYVGHHFISEGKKNTPSFPISKQNKHHNIPSGHILVENHMGLQATVPWGQKLGLQSAEGVSGCLPKLSPSSCASWKSEMWWLLSFLSCLQQCKAPPSGIQEDEANASVSAARTLTLWSPSSLSHRDDSSCCYCFCFGLLIFGL